MPTKFVQPQGRRGITAVARVNAETDISAHLRLEGAANNLPSVSLIITSVLMEECA